MRIRSLSTAITLILALALAGCVGTCPCKKHGRGKKAAAEAKSGSAMAETMDPVAGKWEGWWKEVKREGNGLPLSCDAVQTAPDQWKATFHAVCNIDYTTTVELTGRREGGKVLFGGEADLGKENGGVYTWSGEVVGESFDGKYKNATHDGLFHMAKAKK